MDPQIVVWLIAVVSGSGVTKIFGLFFRGRDVGMILGPAIGTLGGIGAWQGLSAMGKIDLLDPAATGITAAIGGAVCYVVASLMKPSAA